MDAGIGFQKFQLWIDGSLNKDNLSDSVWTILSPLTYGQHKWYVKGYDSLGNNQSSYSRLFNIDNAKPNAFNLTSPTNNQIVDLPAPPLSWQATLDSNGGSGLRKYQLWINGVKNRDSIPISQTTTTPQGTGLPQGCYTWFIKAIDNVDNERQSNQTWTFCVDWEPPTDFTLISPIDNEAVVICRPTFLWHKSKDVGSGLAKYELNISGLSPIVVSPTDTTYTLTSDLSNGSYTWYVKAYDVAGSTTSSNTNNLVVNVPLPDKAATPTGTNGYCINPVNSDFTTSGAANGTSYIWTITPSGAGTISGSGLIGTVDWNNTYSGTAQITVKANNCAGNGILSDPITVTIYPLTVAGSVSGGNSICFGTSSGTLTLSGYTGSINKWQKRLNSGSWVDLANTANTFSEIPSSVGSWEYRAEVQSGTCSSQYSGVTNVIVGDKPSAAGTITGLTTVCQGQVSVTYTVPTITSATSYVWTLPGGATGTSTTNTITVNYGTSAISGDITVKGNNSCGDGTASILAVTVNAIPLLPTATTTYSYCVGATATQLSATGSNLLWYTVSSGGTGNSTAPTPLTTTAGVYDYYVSQSANSCESPRTHITVTVNSIPLAPTATTTYTYCVGATATQLSATGSNLLWYTVPSGGTGNSAAPTPLTTTAGVYDYYVSQSANSCESPRTHITVTVNSIPLAPTATTTYSYCVGATATQLSATGSNLLWYTVSSGGTGNSTAPTPLTTTAGVYDYYVSQSANSCESPRTHITVSVNSIPLAPTATTTYSYCVGATATQLSATGSNLLWYTVPSGGTGNSTAPTPLTTTAGVYDYYVSQSSNSCESPRTHITVTVNSIPSAPSATTTYSYCVGATATQLSATGSNLLWYTVPSGGTGNSTAPTPLTTTAGVYDYYVSQSSNSCESPRTHIVVNVNEIPATPFITVNLNVLHSNSITGNQWYNQNGIVNGATTQDYTPLVEGDYYVIVTQNGCSSAPSNTINITFTGIYETKAGNIINIYPNPVSNELIIEISGNKEQINFEIYNSIGQVVYSGNLLEKTTVKTDSFAAGVYIIKLANGKTFEFKKIIKE